MYRFATMMMTTVIAVVAIDAHAATIIQWSPDGRLDDNTVGALTIKTTGTDAPGNTLSIDSTVSIADQGSGDEFAIGSGIALEGANTVVASPWDTDTITTDQWTGAATIAEAVTANQYIAYAITSTNDMTITDLSFDFWRQVANNNPPKLFAIQYSVDGGAFVQAGADLATGSLGGLLVDDSAPADLFEMDRGGLSIAVAAGETFEVRLYGGDAGNGGSTVHVTGGFINGTVIVPPTLPEPSTLVLAAFGLVGLIGCGRRRKR